MLLILKIVSKIQGNSNLSSELKKWSRYTGFESYINQLSEIERWWTKHSVQAIMPYTIEIENYSLR